jgi:hypothetical protein
MDSNPEGKKGKVITIAAFAAIAYAVLMTIWSLIG